MEKFIRPSLILGGVSGIIFGISLLIPFLAPFMFFLIFLLAGIIVVTVLKKANMVGLLSLQDGCFIGALAGFSSLITTSVVYIPLISLINLLFKTPDGVFNAGYSLTIISYDMLAVLMIVLFTAGLSAIMNAFTGMLTAFVFEKIEKKDTKFEDYMETRVDAEIE